MNQNTANEVNKLIRDMLTYPHRERNAHWQSNMDYLLPMGMYTYNIMLSDRSIPQRHSVGLFATEYPDAVLAKTFTECAMIAAEDHYGLLIMNSVEPDEYMHQVTYGGVWSYLNFDDVGGPVNLRVKFDHALKSGIADPMEHFNSNEGLVSIGKPSEAYLPIAARRFIIEQIEAAHPGAKVDFYLYEEENRIMPISLMVEVTNIPEDTDHGVIASILKWHTPPLLRPGSIVHNRPSIHHALFGVGREDLEQIPTNQINKHKEAEFNRMRKDLK